MNLTIKIEISEDGTTIPGSLDRLLTSARELDAAFELCEAIVERRLKSSSFVRVSIRSDVEIYTEIAKRRSA